jgi:paraquat-inducible protein B
MMSQPDFPEPTVSASPRWLPSLIWAVPLVAALIGLSLAVQAVRQKGPEITVSFASAEGIEPGKTKVKFKNVDIGEVRSVRLADDRKRVVAEIALDKSAESFAVADSRFWVVRPRLGGSGISGLGTLMSGAYIGIDAGNSAERRKHFEGLEDPPVVASDVPGNRFVLSAHDIGSLDVGSPVYFRRIAVGHVESFALEDDGRGIRLEVFVKSPYDRFVTADSRFWHASGIDLNLSADGVKLQTQSLAAIMIGGVAFETPGDGAPAASGTRFDLATDREEAVRTPDGEPQTVVLRFQGSVRGLTIGAPVDFRGVRIGQVVALGIDYDPAADAFSAPVTAVIYPDRLGSPSFSGKSASAVRARHLIKRGLRAQLRTGSLLTGQLYVALDFFPEAKPAALIVGKDGLPELPTIPGDMEELQQQVRAILKKLDAVPFDEIGRNLNRVLVRLDGLSAETQRELLPELRASLAAIAQTLAADAPAQQDARAALRAMAEAARSLKALADGLDRQPESLIRGRKDDAP